MDIRRMARRTIKLNTPEHSIAQVFFTLLIMIALAPSSITIACLWLIGIAFTRGASS